MLCLIYFQKVISMNGMVVGRPPIINFLEFIQCGVVCEKNPFSALGVIKYDGAVYV